MKKALFVLALFVSTFTFAQTEKGSVLVGGGFAMRTGSGSSQFLFNPTVGVCVSNNFMLGGSITLNSESLGELKSSEFGIGPFARYYFGSANTKPFAVAEYDFVTSTTKSTTNQNEIKSNGTRFLIGLGFAAFVNETVAIEGVSGYSYAKFKDVDGSSGFALRLGFGLYFNRKSTRDLKNNVMGTSN